MPFDEATKLLAAIQEVSNRPPPNNENQDVDSYAISLWIMEAAKNTGKSPRTISSWAVNAWTSFVDLIKVGSVLRAVLLA